MSSSNIPVSAAEQQHAALGIARRRTAIHTTHPEAQWFPDAGLGLFLHWGIASVHGDLDLSWAMMGNTGYDAAAGGKNKLTPERYWQLAERFAPARYDPDRWIAAAARAGCQYAVLTSMHHDGYTLWPTRLGDLGVHTHPLGRDLVGPFVEACRRHGVKIGLYYSPPDWHFDRDYMSFNYGSANQERFPGRPHFDVRHQPTVLPAMPPEHRQRRHANYLGRIRELLTRYGRIDLLWLDGGDWGTDVRDLARTLQPHIVLNNRSCPGDYTHSECKLPAERFTGWFETCHCWQQSEIPSPHGGMVEFWGYLKEERYKSTGWMLQALARLRAWGGNLLINVGPRPDGELPEVVYQRLDEVAAWMAHSRRSVIGAGPGSYPQESDVPMTRAQDTVFLHLLPGTSGTVTVSDIPRPATVRLLRTGEAPAWDWSARNLRIVVPDDRRTALVDVIAVE